MGIGLYVHIPFCTDKCSYCDFVSFPFHMSEVGLEEYFWALGKEVELICRRYGLLAVDTVYIGGGTPSAVPDCFLADIFKRLEHFCQLSGAAEITVEANPETLTREKLKAYRKLGVNRLSLGAQACSPELLEEMGRRHSWEDVVRAVTAAREAGFANLGLDLIYGLPGQSLAGWQEVLEKAVALKPEHLSAYGLKLSADSRWGRLLEQGRLSLPGEDAQADMYVWTRRYMKEAGYRHYEISNFARPGYQTRHNLIYWRNQPYIGIGASAASFYNHRRWTNTGRLEDYTASLQTDRLPQEEVIDLSVEDEMAETMIMGLRLVEEGVSLTAFARRFRRSVFQVYGRQVEQLVKMGLLKKTEGRLVLTDIALPIANLVFREFV